MLGLVAKVVRDSAMILNNRAASQPRIAEINRAKPKGSLKPDH